MSWEPAWSQFQRQPLEFQIPNNSNRNSPNRLLADKISYQANELSLIFDPKSHTNDRIDVYLINDTADSFRFERHTLDLPIILEVNLGNDIWERAETRNDKSHLSLRTNELVLDGHYRKRKCRHWEKGTPAKLRYSLYEHGRPIVTSETFDGFLPMGKVHTSRRDLMAAALVPETLQIRYHGDTTKFEDVQNIWRPKLTLLQKLGPSHIELEEVQKWTSSIHSNPVSTREERDLAIQLQTQMLQSWPSTYDQNRLNEFCTNTVIQRKPESQSIRPLCWIVLTASANQSQEINEPELAKLAWQCLQESNTDALENEKKEITRFLCSDTIVDNSPLKDIDDLDELMNSNNSHIRIITANWLITEQSQSQPEIDVMDFYTTKSNNEIDAYELISVLHFNRIYKPYTDTNWDLWLRAFELDAQYTISNLALMYQFDSRKFPKKFKPGKENLSSKFKIKLLSHAQDFPQTESGKLAKQILDQRGKTQFNRSHIIRRRLNF